MKLKQLLTGIISMAMVLMTLAVPVFAADTLPAAEDGVISLTEDVVLAETMVIDEDTTINLNNHSITSADVSGEGATPASLISISDGAKLTIKGPGEVSQGARDDVKVYANTIFTIMVNGGSELVVDGATVRGSKGINTRAGGAAINVNERSSKQSVITIQNGAKIYGGDCEKRGVTSETYSSLNYRYNGTGGDAITARLCVLTITDSELHGGDGTATNGTPFDYISGGANQSNGGMGINTQNGTNAKISGSVITSGSSDNKDTQAAIYVRGNTDLTITDSTVTGGSAGSAAYSAIVMQGTAGKTMYIKGCTVTGGSTDGGDCGSGIELKSSNKADLSVEDSEIAGGTGKGNTKKAYAIGIHWMGEGTAAIKNCVLKAAQTALGVDDPEFITSKENITEVIDGCVAKIGDIGYATLQEAFDAASKGDVVELLGDITLTDSVKILTNLDDITLNGNGHTIYCNMDLTKTALIFGDSSLSKWAYGVKIKDLNMKGTARFALLLCGGSTSELTNVNISGNYFYAINCYGTHGATFTNCDISNDFTGDATYDNENGSAVWSNVAAAFPIILNNTKISVISINKYTTSNTLAPKITVNEGSQTEIRTLDDGAVSGTRLLCLDADSTGTAVVKVLENGEWTQITPAAKVGRIYYETVNKAIEKAAADDTTVKVIADVDNVNDYVEDDSIRAVEEDNGEYAIAKKTDDAQSKDAFAEIDSEKVNKVVEENGFEQSEGSFARGDSITLSSVGSVRKANMKYTYGEGKYFDVVFDMSDITAEGDVQFGILLYNIPSGTQVSDPTVYLLK